MKPEVQRYGYYDKHGRWWEDDFTDFTDADFVSTVLPAGGRPFVLRGGEWVSLTRTPLLVPLGAYLPDPAAVGQMKWEVAMVDNADLQNEVEMRRGLGGSAFFVLQFRRWIPLQQYLMLG